MKGGSKTEAYAAVWGTGRRMGARRKRGFEIGRYILFLVLTVISATVSAQPADPEQSGDSEPPPEGAPVADPAPTEDAAAKPPDGAPAPTEDAVAKPPEGAPVAAPAPAENAATAQPEDAAVDEPIPAENAERQYTDMSLEELLNVEVMIASRTPEIAADAPGSMTVFTREQIQRMGVSTLEELLNYVPGFQVASDAVFGRLPRITVRGLFSTVSSGVLLLRDGIPDWNTYDGSAWHFSRHLMLHDVERVEVIRGPGSTMWGANASSAVINLVTVKDRNTISAGYGTIGRKELSANFYTEVIPELKLSGSAQGYADNGFIFENYTDSFGVTNNIKDPLSKYTVTVRGEYKGLMLNFRTAGTSWREFVNWAAASVLSRNTIERYNADAAYRLDIGSTADITFGLTYADDRYDSLGISVPNGIELIPGVPLADDWIGGPSAVTRSVRLRTDATWRPIDNNTVNLGLSGTYGWIAEAYHFANYNPQTLTGYPSIERLGGDLNFMDPNGWQGLIGFYAQDTHRFGPVALTGGLRVDYTHSNAKLPGPFERQEWSYVPVLPRAAISYHTPIDSTLKLMYGRAFRAPSITELTIAQNPVVAGGLATGNEMQPEIVNTGELAYTQNLFSRVSATATGYVNYVEDLISPGDPLTPADSCFPACPPGSTSLGNHSNLLTTGLEVDLKAEPVNNLLLVGSYGRLFGAWQDGEEVDVEQSTNAFSADVAYTFFNFTIDVNGFYRQKMALVPNQPAYFVLNSRISYEFLDHLELSVLGQNLLDEQYFSLTSYNLPNGAPARGRTFFVALQWE